MYIQYFAVVVSPLSKLQLLSWLEVGQYLAPLLLSLIQRFVVQSDQGKWRADARWWYYWYYLGGNGLRGKTVCKNGSPVKSQVGVGEGSCMIHNPRWVVPHLLSSRLWTHCPLLSIEKYHRHVNIMYRKSRLISY